MDHGAITGTIGLNLPRVLEALLEQSELILQSWIYTTEQVASRNRKRSLDCLPRRKGHLSIIIYGPEDFADDIGRFFQHCHLFLQDPRDCNRNVKYKNPHRLSSKDPNACPWTYYLNDPPIKSEVKVLDRLADVLENFTTERQIGEADQLQAMKTLLAPHQKQALMFMRHRERGWDLETDAVDIWRADELGDDLSYYNRVSGKHYTDAPAEFRGGILADTMGLGKTLSMIALVASDLDPSPNEDHLSPVPGCRATLVVLPPNLIYTWETQLEEHSASSTLRWYRHHGRTRVSREYLNDYDVILTTYQTVSASWAKNHVGLLCLILDVLEKGDPR